MNGAPAVDPEMLPILQVMRERAAADPWRPGRAPQLVRERLRADLARWNAEPPALARVDERTAAGAFGPVRMRCYSARERPGPRPALFYLHGGGWVAGDLDTEDRLLRVLAAASDVVVLSVDYALAPEHRFPESLEDCLAVWRAVRGAAADWGIDPRRLALGGSSAGANLALACALELRDADAPLPLLLLLNYGVYGPDSTTASARRFGDGGYGLSVAQMEYFRSQYLRRPEQRTDPRAAPLLADLGGLPPVFMNAAGLDPLLDDSLALAARLDAAGVGHHCVVYPGVVHGFTLMHRSLTVARTAIDEAATALRTALGEAPRSTASVPAT